MKFISRFPWLHSSALSNFSMNSLTQPSMYSPVPDLFSYSSHISQLRMFGNLQTISIFTSPFDGEGAIIKRIEDIILGSFFTLISLPAMLFVAIGIKLTSPGPIFI